jgi:hypothetical protein
VWLAADPGAAELARTLERVVRFEIEHRIPDEERFCSRLAVAGASSPRAPRSSRTSTAITPASSPRLRTSTGRVATRSCASAT